MANTTDKITDVRNAARPNSARVTSGRSAGGATLACDNLAGWPTASKVHFVTYKIDSNSAIVAGSQLDCYGIVSGNNIGSFTVVDGTDTGHAVGDVVEMLPTAAWGQDLADALSIGHTRTGAHAANLPLTTPILTTPTIADHTNATHTHATAAQGGQLSGSAIATGSQLADRLLNPYKFSVYRAATFGIGNNAYAKISFDTKVFDTGSNYDAVTNFRFNAPIAGFYWIGATVQQSIGSGALAQLAIFKNGSEALDGSGSVQGGATSAYRSVASGLFQLAANDYLEVFCYGTGGAGQPGQAQTYMHGFLVSAT